MKVLRVANQMASTVTRPMVVFLTTVVAFALWTGGTTKQSPDAQLYVRLADALRQGNLGPYLTSEAAFWTVITYPALIAIARSLTMTYWPVIIVAVNVVCAGITGVILVRLVMLVTRSAVASAVALLFYLSAYEIGTWVKFVLTDFVYTALAASVFYLAVRPLVRDEARSGKRRALMVPLLLLAMVTRAPGLVLVPFVLVTELWLQPATLDGRPRRLVWIAILLACLGALVMRAYFADDFRRWPTDYMRPKLQEYVSREKRGEVVYDHPELAHRPPRSTADHLAIEGERFVRFFQFNSTMYSGKHNIMNFLYFMPMYLLALIGVVDGLRAASPKRRALVQATLLLIGGSALLSALTVLDYDFRYRLAMMPQIILLAACGVECLARRVPAFGPSGSTA